MINYLLVIAPLTLLYLWSMRHLLTQVDWSYRGLLLIGVNGLYLSAAFSLAHLLLGAS